MAKLAAAGSLGATDSTVEMGTSNAAVVGVEVSGTWTGTITFETRVGATWENAQVLTTAEAASTATTTANTIRLIKTIGRNAVRARFSTASSGAPLVQFSGTEAGTSVAGAGAAATVDTELPAAAALSDATSNPTAPMVGAAVMGWDGSNWERNVLIAGGDAKNNALVGLVVGAWSYLFNGTTWDRMRGTIAGMFVQGPVATGQAVPANPVYMGASDGTNLQPLKVEGGGNLRTSIVNSGGSTGSVVAVATDAQANAAGLTTLGEEQLYNGATWDRKRGNLEVSLHGSAATGTGTVNTDIVNYNGRFLVIRADVTNYNGGTVLLKAQTQDANGIFVDIPGASTGAIASGLDIILTIGPNTWPADATPVFYKNQCVPRLVRIVQTVATATVTFSASYSLLVA